MPGDVRELPVLELSRITKRFASSVALDDVSLALRRGRVHALLGENGAGKTTLMRIAFGLTRPDEGTLTIAGARGRIASARDAIAAGVGMVHQHFSNVAEMTVAENVALGGTGRFRAADAERDVVRIGERSGLLLDANARAGDLGVGGQQRLEIVKALSRDARILILDEPTAVLAPSEATELLGWLRRFADAGNAVVLITHKLYEALSVADDVTVLRRGRVVLRRPAAGLTADELAVALLGESPSPAESTATGPATDRVVVKAVAVDALSGTQGVRDVHLEMRAGEVIGVAAVEGSGQRELLRALARRLPITRGDLRLPASIGFVPEDRHKDAVILPFSLEENVWLRDSGMGRGMLRVRDNRDRTAAFISTFDVRGGSPRLPMRSLSGGNQQKLVLARELDGRPDLLVVENPTRGLDLRATQAVHARLREAASGGSTVVAYSSDVDELLRMATRIITVHAGRVRETPIDRTMVGRAMLGLHG